MSLAVGTRFPINIAVDTTDGPLGLSTLLSTGPLVVAFLSTGRPRTRLGQRPT
jgi:hypothetical protein